MDVRHTQFTIAEYTEMHERRDVRVDRQYQRSSEVWPRTAQSFLIETILLDYPIPKLFLHQTTDPRTGRTLRNIVDGQQRTRAILDYFDDKYALTNNVTLAEATGQRFSGLPEDLRIKFLEYGLNFDVFVGATDEEVREVFRRMNSFTVPLNAEEQRHAEFQGEFKWFMNTLSTEYAESFRAAGVLNQKSLVRMQDQKLLTEVAAAYFVGIATTNKTTLKNVYKNHDKAEDFPAAERDDLDRRMRRALDRVFSWEELYDTAIVKPYQMYSLILSVMHIEEAVPTLDALHDGGLGLVDDQTVLANLGRLADAIEGGEDYADELVGFVRASAEGTNRGTQRAERFRWFCDALTDDLPA